MKTYSAKAKEVESKWWVVDAEGVILGRLASTVAMMLRGKHKPTFTPNIDTGDHVIIINADKVKITGKKAEQKVTTWYTGHPGGLKTRTWKKSIASARADRVVSDAVQRMLPKDSPLARQQLTKLKVYRGAEHPHQAQAPQVLDFAARNPKNKR